MARVRTEVPTALPGAFLFFWMLLSSTRAATPHHEGTDPSLTARVLTLNLCRAHACPHPLSSRDRNVRVQSVCNGFCVRLLSHCSLSFIAPRGWVWLSVVLSKATNIYNEQMVPTEAVVPCIKVCRLTLNSKMCSRFVEWDGNVQMLTYSTRRVQYVCASPG